MKHLDFNKEGKFRICQVTDIHLRGGELEEDDLKTLALIKKIVISEKPDLLVVTGDISNNEGNDEHLKMLADVCAQTNTKWACALGNHDGTEPRDTLDRKALGDFIPTLKNSLFEKGPEDIQGYGNYFITVGKAGAPSWALVFIDSNNNRTYPAKNANETNKGYDYIYSNQIAWYIEESQRLEERVGHKLGELAFFHNPLPEYNELWGYNECVGQKNEFICCPKTNSGMFAAMVDRGAMRGVFVGHDHINDFDGKLFGIRLCYGRGSGYGAYSMYGYLKGARIIDLDENTSDFSSYICLEDGTTHFQTRVHKPEHNY